jgi:hypothetical protein
MLLLIVGYLLISFSKVLRAETQKQEKKICLLGSIPI